MNRQTRAILAVIVAGVWVDASGFFRNGRRAPRVVVSRANAAREGICAPLPGLGVYR